MTTRSILAGLALWLASAFIHPACGATLEDFGYRHLTVNGMPARGQRPLLVILADTGNHGNFAHGANYYDNLTFSLFTNRSLNGFVLENSGGALFFVRAGPGLLGPVSLTPAELQQAMTNDVMKAGHCLSAAVRAGFNFADLDANGDRTITQDELTVLIVENIADVDFGAARWAHPDGERGASFTPPDSAVAFRTAVCFVSHRVSLGTLCHEVSHLLDTKDLYGVWNEECLNGRLTLMSCTVTAPDDPDIFHLDPWHKMQLGWSQPRIRSLPAGGLDSIPAAQLAGTDKPLLLYDPARGPSEFWLLEYRTGQLQPSVQPNYDAGVADAGLVLWRVKQEANHEPSLTPRFDAGTIPAEAGWRWCGKCQGLHFVENRQSDSPTFGPCPSGGAHTQEASGGYMVVKDNGGAQGQHEWRRCQKCAGLFFGPNFAASVCPAGGTHIAAGGDYTLVQNDESAPGQQDWRWCRRCQGLFYGPNLGQSDCPAGGRHDSTTSGAYAVLLEGLNYVVWAEAAPDFTRGGSSVWHANQVTPSLTWLDGSPTRMRIRVHPFAQGANSITVEWSQEVWVDYTFPGNPAQAELGTFELPFNTLAEAAMAAVPGSVVSFKPGTDLESVSVNKRLRLEAPLGPVTIGR